MSPRRRQRRVVVPLVAVAVSLALHGLIAAAPLVLKRPARLATHLLQFDVVRRKPKPAEPPKKVEPPKPKPRPRPRVQRPVEPVPARPPEQADPGPPAPPVFGATKESVTTGGASFAVPLGNTVATDPANRGPLKPGKPEPPPRPPPPPPPPVRLRDKPRVLEEVRVPYPAKARALGVEGTVRLKVLVGPDGRVLEARVLEGPGFGLDEAARQALFRFRFRPAIGTDGRPMAHWITYRYTFQIDD